MDILSEIHRLSQAIADGQGRQVRPEIERLARSRVPERHRAAVAQLTWRTGQPGLGLRLLRSRVRPRRGLSQATPAQISEYGACLIKNGSAREGLRLLAPVSPGLYPKVLLYQVFGLVSQWRYRESIPLLLKFAEQAGVSPYDRLVAQINLLAAYHFEDDTTAFQSIFAQLHTADTGRLSGLLLGNSLELATAHAIRQSQWETAEKNLGLATAALEQVGSYDRLLLNKWAAILAWHKGQGGALAQFRCEATKMGHWESLRDIDLWTGILEKRLDLLTRVYVGTPYPSYRERMERLVDKWSPPAASTSYSHQLGTKSPVVDLTHPGLGKSAPVPPLLLKLFRTLSQDFYRPFEPARLFEALHSEEVYNADTSPHRIQELVRRARAWLDSESFPMEILESDGRYLWDPTSPGTLLVGLNSKTETDEPLDKLRLLTGEEPFSLQQAASLSGVPHRTLSRWLKKGEEEGLVIRSGKGKATRYQWTVRGLGNAA